MVQEVGQGGTLVGGIRGVHPYQEEAYPWGDGIQGALASLFREGRVAYPEEAYHVQLQMVEGHRAWAWGAYRTTWVGLPLAFEASWKQPRDHQLL